MSSFVTRQCTRADCRLRFPVAADSPLGERCPHCGGETVIDVRYDSLDARVPETAAAARAAGPAVAALLDNVRSLPNVGSMFRTADGAGVSHMHLAGFTPTPAHPKLAKTALGAEATVPWTLHRDAAADCLHAISERGCVDDEGPPPEVCDRVFLGKIGRNGPCLNSAECAGNAVCGFDPTCSDQCCVGACRVFADPVAIGEPCSFGGVACVPEAFCASDPVTFLATVCTKRVKAGGDCSLGQVCVEGVECDGSMCREVEQLKEGDVCDVPFATCVEPARCTYQAEGEPPRCAVPPTLGAPCDPNNDTCDRVDTYCDPASLLCTLLPGPGQACLNGYTLSLIHI